MQTKSEMINRIAELAKENARLKNERTADLVRQIDELKAELQKFKDMAKKGLDEFKDVGGCWGCGLQLQLNQDMEDIKQLKAENARLKSCLQEIKKIAEIGLDKYHNGLILAKPIIDLINKAEEE